MLVAAATSCQMGGENTTNDDTADSINDEPIGLEELDLFEEETIPESADELFDDFLYSYISNADFMRRRTARGVSPLQMPTDQPLCVIYEREEDLMLSKDTTTVQVKMEQIEWEQDIMHIFTFNKTSGQWLLASIADDEISNTPNADFLVFLRDFLTDSLYRHESLRLPLLMCYNNEEGELDETEMTADEWAELYSQLPDMSRQIINLDYGQPLFSKNRKSIQLQELSNGLFMKFHFDFTGERWQLIEINL